MAIWTIPLEDNYNSTLSQAWNGAVGTVYVNATPTFTFPSTRKCYIVVDPWTSKMQVARISAYNSTAKTITVDSTAVYKGAWVLYTEQSHSIGAKVIISDNYQFWADIADELDNKLDDDWGNGVDYASTALRDAALGGDWVATKNYRMIKAWSAYYNYNLSVAQRQIVDTWTAVNVATESTDWIVRLADQTQVNAGTDTEGWSPLVVQPSKLKVVTDALSSAISAKPSLASDAEADTGTDATKAISPSQLKYAGTAPTAGTSVRVAFVSTEKSQTGTTYTQKYIWTILKTWTYTVSFWLSRQNGGSGGTAYGRIYKNWVAFWTEQTTTSAYTTFVTKTENLTFTAWDTISLWLKAGVPASDIAYANNFLLTCDQLQFTLT